MRRLLALLALLCVVLGPGTAAAETLPFFLYMLSNPPRSANSVVGWSVDAQGGLTPIAASPFSTGGHGLANVVGAQYV